MEITHNNKTYRWVGDKFGQWEIFQLEMRHSTVFIDIQGEWISSYHTPEQLVKLGYLEEVKENKEPGQPQEDIELLPEFDEYSYSPEKTTDTDYLSYPQSPGEKNLWKQVSLLTNAVNKLLKN